MTIFKVISPVLMESYVAIIPDIIATSLVWSEENALFNIQSSIAIKTSLDVDTVKCHQAVHEIYEHLSNHQGVKNLMLGIKLLNHFTGETHEA